MKVLSNRKVAWAVLVVCVLTSIIGLGGGSLAADRKDAMRVFNDGIDDSFAVRFSMDAYLENCASYTEIMAQEYRLHVDRNSDLAANVLEIASLIGDGDDLDNRSSSYKALCHAIENLYTDFHAANVSKKDGELFDNAYANFQGEISKLKFDDYHAIAEKFNRSLDVFPANAVAALLGIDDLNTF